MYVSNSSLDSCKVHLSFAKSISFSGDLSMPLFVTNIKIECGVIFLISDSNGVLSEHYLLMPATLNRCCIEC